ncbi:MAG: DUF6166 domain-containing protein [Actinomycetota bacterium]
MEPYHRRIGGGTPVWVNGRQLDRLLYMTRNGEIFTRADRLAMLAEKNPDVEVDGLQFWLSAGAAVYQRDDELGNDELALNILADALGESAARDTYRAFSAEIVSHLPDKWVLTEDEIRRWIFEKSELRE